MSSPDCDGYQSQGLSKCPPHQEEYSTLETSVPLTGLVNDKLVIQEVTVHKSLLLLNPCAKLWYFCRALDTKSQGWVVLSPCRWQLLGESRSTIYRWLREGKELGFFRRYRWQGNTATIRLGGLFKVCKVSKIKSWGTAAKVPIQQLLSGNNRRQLATAITTQDLQLRSHYAARRQLNKLDRKTFDVPTVSQLLDDSQTSPKFTRGGIRGVIGTGDSGIFVDQRFIPFGVSQQTVCDTLNSEPRSCGVSPRTLRRHLDKLGVVKRQLIQTKPEYREIRANFKNPFATSFTCKSDKNIYCQIRQDVRIFEPNGVSSNRREGGYVLIGEQLQRKPYFGRFWMHRCNLYRLDNQLTSMKYSRYLWKKERSGASKTSVVLQEHPETAETLIIPKQPPAPLEGRGAAGGNKADKNDNPQNVDSEQGSKFLPSKTPIYQETMSKLLEMRSRRRQAQQESVQSLSLDPLKEYWAKLFKR